MSIIRLTAALIALLILPGCVRMTLAWTDLNPAGEPNATPPIITELTPGEEANALQAWRETGADSARTALQANIYGMAPERSTTKIIDKKLIDAAAFNGAGRLEEYVMQADAVFGGQHNQTREFVMNVVLPNNASGPAPVILMQTFCPRWDTLPHPGIARPAEARSCSDGFMSGAMFYVFGRYIATPPVEEILKRGYGLATIFPGEIVPDRAEAGLAALKALSHGHDDDATRWGAIGAWGWAFSRMVDALEQEPRIDQDAIIAYGHSRYGKSALVAGAFDARIDAVIAHQSGTGGASLNREKKGESVKAITEQYPHWFAPVYASFAGREGDLPIDQHHLLALLAPRPILLGNARRDVWSDPNGAFRAAMGADPVYKLYGKQGLEQSRLNEFVPSADLSFWIRPGTHGVVEEDWPAFLQFLDAHFTTPDAAYAPQ